MSHTTPNAEFQRGKITGCWAELASFVARALVRFHRLRVLSVLVVFACLTFMAGNLSWGDNIYWQSSSGDWFNASNWISSTQTDINGKPLNLIPGSIDVAHVDNGGNSLIASDGAVPWFLYVDGSSTVNLLEYGSLSTAAEEVGRYSTGVFTQIGGTNTTGYLYLGTATGSGFGTGSSGSYIQSGGTNTITNALALNTGVYALDDGNLLATSERIGDSGTALFTQTGGTNTVGTLHFRTYGSYDLQNGELSADEIRVDWIGSGASIFTPTGAALFTQTGGTVTVGFLYQGIIGSYDLQNGKLIADCEDVYMTQSGGSNTANVISGHYKLMSGSLSANYEDSIAMIQTGGSNTVRYGLFGSYQLMSGSLSADFEHISMTQEGGSNIAGQLKVDDGYHLLNGILSVASELIEGPFNQTGGTHTVTGQLTIYTDPDDPDYHGTYNWNGGTLTAGSIVVKSGGILNVHTTNGNGGTLTADSIVVNAGGVLNAHPSQAAGTPIAYSLINSGVINLYQGAPSAFVQVEIAGDYTQTKSGMLNVQIDGTGAGQFGQLTVGSASLAGKLNVTLGSNNGTDFIPSTLDTYQIIISSTQPKGKFNYGRNAVEAKFSPGVNTYYNNGSAGLFDVSYDADGVTLSRFHQIHVLSVGIDDYDANPAPPNQPGYTITGKAMAQRVAATFAHLPGVVDDVVIGRSSTDAGNANAMLTAINNIEVRDGDTFVFYINTHGLYGSNPANPNNEVSSPREQKGGWQWSTAQTELFLSVTDGTQNLTASQFADQFNQTKWDNVNKLFIIDTCYAGGFWESSYGDQLYLASLPHSAIIAAAPESLFSYGIIGDGYGIGGGNLGDAVVTVLNSWPTYTDLTLEELEKRITVAQDVLFKDTTGWIQGGPSDNWGTSAPFTNNLFSDFTPDFSLGMTGNVPEPASLTFLALGAVGLLISRRRK